MFIYVVLVLFCFFKQKTAYEMRISDWSSDVCSSDLDLTIVLLATVPLQDLKQIRELTDAAGVALVDCGVTGGQTVRQNGLVCLVGADEVAFARARPVLEIGRASCRERRGQYV